MNPNVEVNPKRAIGARHVDTELLVKRLAKAQMGDVITYAELSAIIGSNIQNEINRTRLASARDIMLAENKIAFDVVRNQGLVRMNDENLSEHHKPVAAKIRRAAKKGIKTMLCAKTEDLSPEKQRAFSAGLSVLGAVQLFTSTKNVLKLADSLKPSAIPQKVNVEEIAKLFAK